MASNFLEGDFDYIPKGLIKAGIRMEKMRMRNFLTKEDRAVIATSRPGVYSRKEWQHDKRNLLRHAHVESEKAIVVLPDLCVTLAFKNTGRNDTTNVPEFVAAVLGTKLGTVQSIRKMESVGNFFMYTAPPEEDMKLL